MTSSTKDEIQLWITHINHPCLIKETSGTHNHIPTGSLNKRSKTRPANDANTAFFSATELPNYTRQIFLALHRRFTKGAHVMKLQYITKPVTF